MAQRLAMGRKPPVEGTGLDPLYIKYKQARKNYEMSRKGRSSGVKFPDFNTWKKSHKQSAG